MISAVIVTVKIAGEQQQHDMELPVNVPIKELAPKLLKALKSIEHRLFMSVENIKIRYDKENRYLSDIETLASVGAWDGSVIIVEKGGDSRVNN